jgi:RNA polymerase sigma-32 factor
MEQRLSQSDLSFNAPTRRDDSSSEFGDFIPARGESAEHSVGDKQLRAVFLEKVYEFAATLDERDRKLVDERVLAENPKTLAELGEELGISRERVRQLEARLVDRLREYLKENLVDFEYYAPSSRDE